MIHKYFITYEINIMYELMRNKIIRFFQGFKKFDDLTFKWVNHKLTSLS